MPERGDAPRRDPQPGADGRVPRNWPDLLLRHLSERLSIAPNRRGEDDEILNGAAEHDTDNDPDRARKKAKLRRECRTNSGPGPAIAAKWWPNTIQRFVGT